ncbi:MAG: tyrosine-protein phosphatase [Clostridia bacterium]|nr:tyrosine-protein phosphatase [Clostridia bacterium]
MIRLISPLNGDTVSQKKEVMKIFEENIEENAKHPAWCSFASEEFGVCTIPEPVRFEWNKGDGSAYFELSDVEDFSRIIYRAPDTGSFSAYNLFVGKQYWWRVGDSEIRTFCTEDRAPRWMYVEGTFNVRDIGGYVNVDGKRIRQGLLYRGCQFDAKEQGMAITERGRYTILNQMGIKFELDLRGSGVYSEQKFGSLGPDVGYLDIDSEYYEALVEKKENVLTLLDVVSDPRNYPIYIHCVIGTDRTGSFLALLEGLLGIEYEDACRDYEMSTLCFPDSNRSRYDDYWVQLFKKLEPFGDSYRERCYNHAIWCGATPEQIETIRKIFIEE